MYINEAKNNVGKLVEIKGWVYNVRSSGKIIFVLVRDGTGIMQCVVSKNDVDDATFNLADKLTQESSIIIKGIVREDKRAPFGYELLLKDLNLVQLAQDYPITPKEHGVGFLMEHRHLWIRSKRQWAILRIRHQLIKSLRDFFDNNGFTLIDAPILTPAAAEGTTTLFETNFFGEKAYLSQSGQLYMEAAAMAFGKVYCFGPTFRAEKSKTRRHLVEFWMLEPEVAYLTYEGNLKLQEEMLYYAVQGVLRNCKTELEIIERDIKPLEKIEPPFPRLHYRDAIDLLNKKGVNVNFGDDFGADEETIISNEFEKPVFIHHFPKEIKAFYMQPDPNEQDTVLAADLLAPEGYGEIIGGSERIYDYDLLLQRIKENNLPLENYQWYLDLRKYGTVPHSGFGIGLERTLAWVAKLPHVRETIPFPRMLEKMYP
ncbi:MAG: asparagine--tRNA ligase [Candidatus Atribacteria bacterium]|nr:asparagine--tRNA ligase [Candidatus Atribacteria bacterium]